MDSFGNVFIADKENKRIREVFTSGTHSGISGLYPSTATAGGLGFTLMVDGAGFVNGSSVQWNGIAVATSYISANQLSASIPASLTASAGNVSVSVGNTAAGTSNSVPFTINPPPAVISALGPSSATAGGPTFTLTVNGTGFVTESVVEWNGAAVAASYISANQLSASIPSSMIVSVGNSIVTVLNPGAGPSNAVIFAVSAAGQTVVITTYAVPSGANGSRIIPGPDGALWFAESSGNRIGRVTTAGVVTEYALPTANSGPAGVIGPRASPLGRTARSGLRSISATRSGGSQPMVQLPNIWCPRLPVTLWISR